MTKREVMKSRRHWHTDANRKAAVPMALGGVAIGRIAQELDRKPDTIRGYLREAGYWVRPEGAPGCQNVRAPRRYHLCGWAADPLQISPSELSDIGATFQSGCWRSGSR